MTLTLHISSEAEKELRARAGVLGVDVVDYAARLLEQAITFPAPPRAPLGDLFAAWDAEDATDDPAEVARRQREFEDFKKSMNENRLSSRPLFP